MNKAPSSTRTFESQRAPPLPSAIAPAPHGAPTPPSSTALWFGPADRPLFGTYHAPARRARAAVVLCNPIGHEALVFHRSYRRLALQLAAQGFAVLRFDYDGTGDSAGSDEDPNRVESWLESIGRAAEEASTLSGCADVVLVGTRLGALLAATYAERAPVAGLVLIAPPRAGRAWVREARALQSLKDSQLPQIEGVEPDHGIAGFLLSEATRAELNTLYFSKTTRAPARHAFVVARDDLPAGEVELARHLNDIGVKAELCIAPGYAASMPEDPFKAVVPTQIFDSLGAWLETSFPGALAAPNDEPAVDLRAPIAASPDPSIREHVVDVSGLFGILSEPSELTERSKTGVVLLNIGANHHVGSNRMYVHMARNLANQGFQVLRMDFSGMGESRLGSVGKENDVYASRFMVEARSAVDTLIERGATRVVLMGLCSGAYVAYHTATADPRVSAVVLVNPLTFHWTEGDSLEVRMRKSFGSTEQYKRRLFRYDTWSRIVRGKVSVVAISGELARRVRQRATYEAKSVIAKLTGDIAEQTDIERGFKRMSARGTSTLLILGADDGARDVIEAHLGKDASAMKTVSRFKMEIWPGTDHTFTPLWAQRKLIQAISDYLVKEHGNG